MLDPAGRKSAGREKSSRSDQHGLELPPLQGGQGRVGHQGEIGHQRGGLMHRVVLAEGDEVVVLPGQQLADVPRRAAEAVVLKCQVWEQDFFSFFVNGIK